MVTSTLKQFINVMRDTIPTRKILARDYLMNYKVDPDRLQHLQRTYQAIEQIPNQSGRKLLQMNHDKTIEVDVNYELEELKKDIWFFERGEEAFIQHLKASYKLYEVQLAEGLKFLEGINFNAFITDRDGTVNNYCGRYSTSVQSAYNAVFIGRFAAKKAKNTVLLTSAPLMEPGLLDISVIPEKLIHFAGSKGREYFDKEGLFGYFPIEKEKQDKLDELNAEIRKLIKKEEYEIFARIGSGLQEKFGQTTIARQDVNQTVDAEKSETFLEKITEVVNRLDPDNQYFRIEDTGLDIEIILTISGEGQQGLKDFDKGDGVRFLNERLKLDLEKGPNLICGDTHSDLAMLKTAMDFTDDTYTVFVSRDNELKNKVREICPNHYFADKPDTLISMLNQTALK